MQCSGPAERPRPQLHARAVLPRQRRLEQSAVRADVPAVVGGQRRAALLPHRHRCLHGSRQTAAGGRLAEPGPGRQLRTGGDEKRRKRRRHRVCWTHDVGKLDPAEDGQEGRVYVRRVEELFKRRANIWLFWRNLYEIYRNTKRSRLQQQLQAVKTFISL